VTENRWLDGWTVSGVGLVMMLLAVYPSSRLVSQVEIHLAAGVRYSSTLVTDEIVTPLELRPALAPAVAVTVFDRSRGPWMPDVQLDFTSGSLQRYQPSGAGTRIGTLTTLAVSVGLRRELGPGVTARAGVGGLKYLPGDQSGVFRDGAAIAPLGSLAIEVSPRFALHRRLGLAVRYDAHRFITPALRRVGFIDARLVHRVAITVRGRVL
jgi:hypothetical protein